jgi:hypothetical protein
MDFGTSELVQIKQAMLDRARMFYRLAYSTNARGHEEDFLNIARSVTSTMEYISKELEKRG